MPKGSLNVSLKGADDIFSTEESRQEQQREQVQQIPIGELFPFKNHPFKVLNDESIYMSRFYNNCVDEASLTTLCPICLDSFQGAKGVRVRRADPKQKIKDVCTYCQIRYGFDYYVQPDKNAGQYMKRGHFDDESECA